MSSSRYKAFFNGFSFVRFITVLVVLIIFTVVHAEHLNLDFWNDELYTLKEFTLVPLEKTIFDYHVPNNHIFYNLLNNLYLKLIGVDSLGYLLERPYVLRIIPFIYGLLSLFLTYDLSNRLFNSRIAFIACLLLITTVPHYFFTLQIRGYGLSTLLLLIIVRLTLSYMQFTKVKYLVMIALCTSLLFYTIPSNIYGIATLLIVFAGSGFIYAIGTRRKGGESKHQKLLAIKSLFLFSSILSGVILTLLLYSPIFEDVFFNEYVVGGAFFDSSRLHYYFSEVLSTMLSNRWLIVFSLLFLIYQWIEDRKVVFSTVLILALCLIPLFFPFLRGDKTPLRVFTIFTPYFSILFAASLYSFLNTIRKKRTDGYLFSLVVIAVYALITFTIELNKAESYVLSDIKSGGRSQDLYHQYYSFHYTPLLSVNSFKSIYEKENLPVIIDGCEPHGVTHYLSKYNIPHTNMYFDEHALDDALSKSDSIYLVTNHPNSYDRFKEFKVTLMNSSLSYHNFLKVERKEELLGLGNELDSLEHKFGDSIRFVFNSYDKTIFNNIINDDRRFYFSKNEQHGLGKLISFVDSAKYICYLETYSQLPIQLEPIINDGMQVVFSYDSTSYYYRYTLVSRIAELPDLSDSFYNDFESPAPSRYHLDSAVAYEGKYSERLDTMNIYSSGFSDRLGNRDGGRIKVSFKSLFDSSTESILVLSVNRSNEQIHWEGLEMSQFYTTDDWNSVITAFDVSEFKKSDSVKIYIWNPKKENIWIDNFFVE